MLEDDRIWETIFDLSYWAGNDNLVECPPYDNDSRLLYDDIQTWAMEFEKKYNFDFDGSGYDYLIEIDKFYEEKKKEVLSY